MENHIPFHFNCNTIKYFGLCQQSCSVIEVLLEYEMSGFKTKLQESLKWDLVTFNTPLILKTFFTSNMWFGISDFISSHILICIFYFLLNHMFNIIFGKISVKVTTEVSLISLLKMTKGSWNTVFPHQGSADELNS